MKTPPQFTPASLREMINALQPSRVILTGYELGIFTALGAKQKTSEEVARMIKTAPKATDRLMNALCAIGLLDKKNNLFANTDFTARFLVQGKPEYLLGLRHSISLWNSWSHLTEAVRKGTAVFDGGEDNYDYPRGFIAAMHERAYKFAPETIKLLNLNNVARVLDVGGGSGAYSMAFVKAKPGITATVFDQPEIVPLIKEYVNKEKLADRIDTLAGNYHEDIFGKGYDLIFLSAVIHINSASENQKLLDKCVKALNPNGQVVIQDFIMDDDRVHPANAALFALNMLARTESGDTYTESEVREWMQKSGLVSIIRKDTPFNTALIIGIKAN